MREPRAHTAAGETFAAVSHAGFLQGHLLAPFKRQGTGAAAGSSWQYAGSNGFPPLFSRIAEASLAELLDRAQRRSSPQVTRTPAGLYFFALPLGGASPPWCLACGGVRDARLDLLRVEELAVSLGEDPLRLLEEFEALPVATFGSVAELAGRTFALVRLLSGHDPVPAQGPEGDEPLRLVLELSAELDRAATRDDALALLAESLGILFDLQGVATILPAESGPGWQVCPAWGAEFTPFALQDEGARHCLGGQGTVLLPMHDLAGFLPSYAGNSGICVPLLEGNATLGALLLVGERLRGNDLLMQELLIGRAAARIAGLQQERQHAEQVERAERLVQIFTELTMVEGMEELCRNVLERGAKLVGARSGSLMLLDRQKEFLTIAAVKGMHPMLARRFTVKLGSGIAGQVALTGQPVLVNDIVNDERFTVGHRSRFKTGSLISLPLSCRGETIGVLNLADRADQTPFGNDDLELLTRLTTHAAGLLLRMKTAEGVQLLERLSITDPLTELYNRRFLERRMDEELSRSVRNGLRLSVMMLDLDNFKLYNDLCGHPAGDRALRKVAQLLQRSVREMDVVTRYGGEEFCILLPDTPNVDAHFVAERIRYAIEHELFAGEEGLPSSTLTISIGIATYPDNGACGADLISTADVALYQAKTGGRNRIVSSLDLPTASRFRIVAPSPQQTH